MTTTEPRTRTETELPHTVDFDEMCRLFPERPSSWNRLAPLLIWLPFRKKKYCPLGMLLMYLGGILDPKKASWEERFPEYNDGARVLLQANPCLGEALSRNFTSRIINKNDLGRDPDEALTILRNALQYRPS
ncbi:MAG: hypothetical protein AABX37_02215 [Nanoarchaeota archaeon]